MGLQLIAEPFALGVDAPAEFSFLIEVIGQINDGSVGLNDRPLAHVEQFLVEAVCRHSVSHQVLA